MTINGQVLNDATCECRTERKPRGLNIGDTLIDDWKIDSLVLYIRIHRICNKRRGNDYDTK